MTAYTLKPEAVRDCLQRLLAEPIHRMFPGYLCLHQQSMIEGRTTGLPFPYNEFFDDYLRVLGKDADKPYFVPFSADATSPETLWLNKNVSGTYAPSSIRPTAPLMQLAEIESGGYNSEWRLVDDHWRIARLELGEKAQIPVESLAAYLLRDFAFDFDEPSAYSLVTAFTEEFGYELGGEAFSHLYRTGDSNITEDSFEQLSAESVQTNLGVENPLRSPGTVRRLTPVQLGIASSAVEEQSEAEQWQALQDAAEDVASDDGMGAAVRTDHGDVASGSSLSAGQSRDVHALELAVWNAAVGTDAPVTEAIVVSERDGSVPCGRCLQVAADFADDGAVMMRVVDRATDDVTEFALADRLSLV